MNSPVETLANRLGDWLGLIRFSHTIFALPFAALATVMALATPLSGGDWPVLRARDLVGILICMVLARSAAMAFNRLVDQQIDAANPRTATRHLPAGRLGRGQVWAFTLACAIGFVAATTLFLPNWLPLAFAIPVLLFLLGYSLAKRFTAAAHLWLGVALSLSPICAWIAIRGTQVIESPTELLIPFVLASVVIAWVTGFDIIYACQDAVYDAKVGLHSVPAKFGIAGALRIAAACHGVMLVLILVLIWVGGNSGLGWPFAATWVIVAGLIVRQHRLVRPNDLARVNQAFFDTNAVISVLLLVAGIMDCWWL
jgi:4-hydroxybenzoate polyprenyltransferase